MYHHIKKCSFFLILIILIPLLTSCAAASNKKGINRIPFNYYENIYFNDIEYQIYTVADEMYFDLNDLDGALIYYYKEYEKKGTDQWIINYYDAYQFRVSDVTIDEKLLDDFYSKVSPIIENIEQYLNLSFETHSDETRLEKEFIIDNIDCDSVMIIDMYIPFKLVNSLSYETNVIYIPVKTFLAYRNNYKVIMIYDENKKYEYNYYDFIRSYTVFMK